MFLDDRSAGSALSVMVVLGSEYLRTFFDLAGLNDARGLNAEPIFTRKSKNRFH
jgi:hypothetical protein